MSKKLKPKYLFGKKINFNAEYLSRDFYDRSSLENLGLINKLCFSSDLVKAKKGSEDYIKIYLMESKGKGIVIGQTTKKEGYYSPSVGEGWESEPAEFIVKKSIPFWKVAVGFNHIVLVPKSSEYCQIKGVDF